MRNLLLLGLLLWGNAGAVTLYTVTVKMAPVFDRSEFLVAPSNPALKKLYTQTKKGVTATFKLPEGTYTFYVQEPKVKPERYGVGSLTATISSNRTLTIPTDPWPVMDAGGRAAFNQLLIKMGGNFSDCDDPMADVSQLCADVQNTSWGIVRSYVQLDESFVQTEAWRAVGAKGYSASFALGGNRYGLFAYDGADGTSLVFSRLK